MTSADVDGDGDADMMVANVDSDTVSVLKNNGDGTFAAKVDYATGDMPFSVTSADVDGDGDADMMIANGINDTVSVLKNNGDGTFAAKVDFATGDGPFSVTSVDVDGDGDADMMVANAVSNTVSVLKNNGDGTFAAKVDYATGDGPFSVTSADVDGDGDADMLVANEVSDTVSVLKNNVDGTFAAKVDYATGYTPCSMTSADVDGDVDGDGDADMMVANVDSDTVSVLKNNGDGTFAAKVDYATGDGPWSVTSADVDGDGDADLLVANNFSDTVSVLLNTTAPAVPVALEQTAVQVSSGVLISDPDGDASWGGGTLKVQVFSNAEAADSLFLPDTNPSGNGIWLDPSGNKVMAGTTEIGAADAASVLNNTVWTLTFNANATNALVQEVARAVRFINSSDDPGTDNRTIRFTVTDNEGGTAHVDQVVRVEAVNDAPTLTGFSEAVVSADEDTMVEISFADLLAKGDEADVDGAVEGFVVKGVTSGTLKIGISAESAQAWSFSANKTIDAAHHAYWLSGSNSYGNIEAFSVVAVDDGGAASLTAIKVRVEVNPVSDLPEISIPGLLSFAAKVDYATGDSPVSLTSADVDGDGDADMLVANEDSDTVSVLKNNGDGTFAAKVDYATGWWPSSVTSADVDGDGDTDMMVANDIDDTVSVLKNNGDGTFAAKVDYATGCCPQSVSSADVDGDGDADMLVANYSDTVSVLKNNGDGTFAAKVDYATGDYPQSVTSADVDGDGDADMLVANAFSDTVSVLKNNGDGTFAAKVDYATGDYPVSLTSADVDGDGDADMLVANEESYTVSVLLNIGDGTFAPKVDYTVGSDTDANPRSVICSDIDGDGDADMLVANAFSDTVSVLKNNGDGTFAAKVDYATGCCPQSVTSADVDGDGDTDMMVANYNDTVSVLLNTTAPAVTVALEQTAVQVSSGVLISDPDGDASWDGGTLQVQVFSNAEAADSLFLPDTNPSGNGIWLDPSGNKVMAGATEIGAADAASVSNNTVWTLTFNANATNALVQEVARAVQFINSSDDPGTDDRTIRFTVTDNEGGTAHVDQVVRVEAVNDAPTLTGFSEAVVSADEDTMVEISFADLLAKGDEADVDGAVEGFVVKGVTSGTLKIGISAESAQAWSFSANNTIDAAHHAYWLSGSNSYGNIEAFSVVAVDDGGAESLTAIEVGVEVNPVSDLPEIFIPAISYSAKVDYATGDYPVSLTSADVDGDGDADMLVANEDSDTVSVLKNNGDGTFAAKVDYATGDMPYSVTSADVDGDGDADMLVANAYSDTVSVLLNKGDGTFAAKVDYATGYMPFSVTSADVDGDGDADMLVANVVSDTVSVLLNNGDGTFAAKVDYATGDMPFSVTSADVDGDGDADMLVANEDSDTVSVLKNNGDGTFAAKVDYATGDMPFSVTSADVDGDGDADMLVANVLSDTVSVLKNNGDGTFAAKVDYATGYMPFSVTSADVDGDGDADMLVANVVSDTVSVLLNNGDGTFAAKVDFAAGDGPISVTSADVDGDVDTDMMVANYNSDTVSVLLNTTAPAPAVTVALEQTAVQVSSDVLISDPDGDASWDGGTLQVQVFSNAEAADSLILPAANPGDGGIWLDPSGNKVMAGATEIGAADAASVSNNTVWTLTFNANATNALVQEVARAVQFINSSDDPGTDDRTIRFTVTDNEGGTAHVDQVVRVEAVNDAPTLTGFSGEVDRTVKNTEVEISFTDLAATGDETDVDGTVEGFVVKEVVSGTLRIGADAASATAWDAAANNRIDAAHQAYWTPGVDANGSIDAFTVVTFDNGGLESSTPVQAMVDVLNPVQGTTGNDTIAGGNGDDLLDGGSGADQLAGGAGDDVYVVDNAKDVVKELAGAGTDTVQASVTYKMPSNIENLTLTGGESISGKGNAGANVITGNDADNLLDGATGADTIYGCGGNDTIKGGLGVDEMTGGAGNDTFIFDYLAVSESGIIMTSHDIITDFVSGEDVLDLSAVDANVAVPGNQAFGSLVISATNPFTAPGQLWFDSATGLLSGNTDSNPMTAEITIQLTGVTSLAVDDIIF
jgi:Ca2+-binding RTX toxin-like protein